MWHPLRHRPRRVKNERLQIAQPTGIAAGDANSPRDCAQSKNRLQRGVGEKRTRASPAPCRPNSPPLIPALARGKCAVARARCPPGSAPRRGAAPAGRSACHAPCRKPPRRPAPAPQPRPKRLRRAGVEKDSHFVLASILSVPRRISAWLRRNILPGARWHRLHSRPRSRSGDGSCAVPPPRRLAHSALRKTLASKGRAAPSQGKARQTEFVMPCTPCCGQFLSAAERLCSAGRSTALDGRRRQACWDRLCRASLNGMRAHLRSPWGPNQLGLVAVRLASAERSGHPRLPERQPGGTIPIPRLFAAPVVAPVPTPPRVAVAATLRDVTAVYTKLLRSGAPPRCQPSEWPDTLAVLLAVGD